MSRRATAPVADPFNMHMEPDRGFHAIGGMQGLHAAPAAMAHHATAAYYPPVHTPRARNIRAEEVIAPNLDERGRPLPEAAAGAAAGGGGAMGAMGGGYAVAAPFGPPVMLQFVAPPAVHPFYGGYGAPPAPSAHVPSGAPYTMTMGGRRAAPPMDLSQVPRPSVYAVDGAPHAAAVPGFLGFGGTHYGGAYAAGMAPAHRMDEATDAGGGAFPAPEDELFSVARRQDLGMMSDALVRPSQRRMYDKLVKKDPRTTVARAAGWTRSRARMNEAAAFDNGRVDSTFGPFDAVKTGEYTDPRTGERYEVFDNGFLAPDGDYRQKASGAQRLFDTKFGGWGPTAPRIPRRPLEKDDPEPDLLRRRDPDEFARERQMEQAAIAALVGGSHHGDEASADGEGYGQQSYRMPSNRMGLNNAVNLYPMPALHLHRAFNIKKFDGRGSDGVGPTGTDGPMIRGLHKFKRPTRPQDRVAGFGGRELFEGPDLSGPEAGAQMAADTFRTHGLDPYLMPLAIDTGVDGALTVPRDWENIMVGTDRVYFELALGRILADAGAEFGAGTLGESLLGDDLREGFAPQALGRLAVDALAEMGAGTLGDSLLGDDLREGFAPMRLGRIGADGLSEFGADTRDLDVTAYRRNTQRDLLALAIGELLLGSMYAMGAEGHALDAPMLPPELEALRDNRAAKDALRVALGRIALDAAQMQHGGHAAPGHYEDRNDFRSQLVVSGVGQRLADAVWEFGAITEYADSLRNDLRLDSQRPFASRGVVDGLSEFAGITEFGDSERNLLTNPWDPFGSRGVVDGVSEFAGITEFGDSERNLLARPWDPFGTHAPDFVVTEAGVVPLDDPLRGHLQRRAEVAQVLANAWQAELRGLDVTGAAGTDAHTGALMAQLDRNMLAIIKDIARGVVHRWSARSYALPDNSGAGPIIRAYEGSERVRLTPNEPIHRTGAPDAVGELYSDSGALARVSAANSTRAYRASRPMPTDIFAMPEYSDFLTGLSGKPLADEPAPLDQKTELVW